MAARTHKIYLYKSDDLNIMVYEKEVKRITFRISRRDPELVLLSVPVGIDSATLRNIIDGNKGQIMKLRSKVSNLDTQTLHLPQPGEIEKLRRRMESLVPELEYAMGVKASRYTIRYMTSRWGSCSPTHRKISINAALGQIPPEYTEYVLIHELAHLTEANHSPAFWNIVARYCPNWRQLRAGLKRYQF